MGLVTIFVRLPICLFWIFVAGLLFFWSRPAHLGLDQSAEQNRGVTFLDVGHLRAQLIASVQTQPVENPWPLIRDLARAAPLDVLSYEAALVATSVVGGEPAETKKFAELALSFQPRSRVALIHTLKTAELEQDDAKLIETFDILSRTRALCMQTLEDAFLGVFRQSGNYSPLFDYLETSPERGQQLVLKLLNESVAHPGMSELMIHYSELQHIFLMNQLRAGAYSEAYSAWKLFGNLSDADTAPLPFNGRFEIKRVPAPFNWTVNKSKGAELLTSGGLAVHFRGTGSQLFARQYLVAPSGRYHLKTLAQADKFTSAGHLEWRLVCHESRKQLIKLRMDFARSREVVQLEAEFEIPDNSCSVQMLSLRGVEREFGRSANVKIISIELSRE